MVARIITSASSPAAIATARRCFHRPTKVRKRAGCYFIGESTRRVYVRELRGMLMCRVGG